MDLLDLCIPFSANLSHIMAFSIVVMDVEKALAFILQRELELFILRLLIFMEKVRG